MNAKKTPLAQVNEDHGGKSKLVDAILGLVDIGDEDKDSARGRLLKASNKKLLRLRANSAAVKEKYGSVEKLVGIVAEKLGRAKDSDFVHRLEAFTPGKLLDLARSLAGEPRRPIKGVSAKITPKAAPVKKVRAKVVAKPTVKKKATPAAQAAKKKKAIASKKQKEAGAKKGPGKK